MFSRNFITFLKCTIILEHFGKKDEPRSLSVCGNIDCKRRGYVNVQNVLAEDTL